MNKKQTKKIEMKPFAPKGFLTELQNERLKLWILDTKGELRTISLEELSKELGMARSNIYKIMKKNPNRPFDDFKLGAVNKLVATYNKDLQETKTKIKKETETNVKKFQQKKERVEKLIKRVDE